MKKAGLYDKNRYPYNARLLQSSNASFDTRGSSIALGSGVRGPSVQRATRHNRFQESTASSDTRSHGSDRMADFDGFSDTKSQRSYASSRGRMTSPATVPQHTLSTINMDDDASDKNIMPSVQIRTKFTWAAFVLQMLCTVLGAVAFFSPGWGRAKQDRSEDPDVQAKVFLYYGLYLRCTLQQYEEYWGDLDCITNAVAGMAGKARICSISLLKHVKTENNARHNPTCVCSPSKPTLCDLHRLLTLWH